MKPNPNLVYIIRILIISVVLPSINGCSYLLKRDQEVKRVAEIETFYQKWRGVGYQYGGRGRTGIDCSALMVEAYDELYNIHLPRTTKTQSDLGKRVRLKNLRAGDLIFFKTGKLRRHVGIYLEEGVFVHASQSRGVVKSFLFSDYWWDRYWKAKRVLN